MPPVQQLENEALVWTDGACSGNPGPGGWAAIVVPPGGGDHVELSFSDPDTTNNRIDLTAALRAKMAKNAAKYPPDRYQGRY